MRISDNTFTNNYLISINNSRARMSKLQDQLSTGRRVLTPSDDPEATNKILQIKNSIAKNEQYQANVSDGSSMIQATSSALDSFSNLMLEVKNIVTKARSGGSLADLSTFAAEIDHILTNAVQTANTKFNGKYLFGGTQTTSQPFTLAADRSAVTANPTGITGTISIPVSEGTTQVINIDGQEAFLGTQMFQTLIDIRDAMNAGTVPTAAQYDAVDSQLSHVTDVGGKAGAIQNALEMDDQFLQDRGIQLASLLSGQEDTDFADATLKLKKEEIMLDAALSLGSRLIPKSLLDFLK